MIEELQSQIAENEKNLEALRIEMGDARDAWLQCTGGWLAEYWIEQARAVVVSQSQRAKDVGSANIQEIRSQVESLAGRADGILREELVEGAGSSLWPDLIPQRSSREQLLGGSYYRDSPFRIISRSKSKEHPGAPSVLKPYMKKLEDRVLRVLDQQGFYVAREGYSAEADVRFERLRKPWTPAMVETMNGYAEAHGKYVSCLESLEKSRDQLSQTEAANLWDER